MKKVKVRQRVPLDQFAYIEFEEEYDNVQEAIAHNAELVKMNSEAGLPEREWARVRNKMLSTGEFDPNITNLSKAQMFWVNQTKLALRALKADDPVIN